MADVNRRDFLGGTASATAATYLVSNTVFGDEAASNRIVVGVMGMSRGRSLATSFAERSGVQVKYVADVDKNRAAVGAAAVEKSTGKAPKAVQDFRAILEDPDVDVLVCAAPNHWHAPATIMATAAGKHVYVEKPCSHNPAEGELMIAAARKHNKAVQVGTQRRSSPPILQAMEEMWSGRIGRVYHSNSWYGNVRGTIGKGKPAKVPDHLDYDLWQGPAPRAKYYDNRIHYNWHWFWHYGNGELGNNGVHSLDLSRMGLQVDYPTRVVSAGGRYRFDDDQETPDTHNVAFEFPGKKSISWDGLSCNRHRNAFVTFYGEKGALVIEGSGTAVFYDELDRKSQEFKGSKGDIEHIDNLLKAIRTGRHEELNAEVEIGHKSTLLCHLGNISQRVGRALNCSSKDGHILLDDKANKLWSREYEPGWEPQV